MVPSLFIGHGSPYLAVTQNEYSDFLKELGKRIKPKAIVIFSAHWESQTLSLTYTDDILDTVYDYYGFPEEMYKIKYPAKGSKMVANILEDRFEKAGIQTKREEVRGLDHGVWVALSHMYPDADIPVVELSVNPFLSPKEQFNIGAALKGIEEENILVIGSGTTVHNFQWMYPEATSPVKEAVEFDNWIFDQVQKGDIDTLDQYRTLAPNATLAVPRPEHFVPLFIAMGSASDKTTKPIKINQTYDFGTMSNMCIEF
ncbi:MULTISPECIES: DODA-type extradiol aromatic ring-opening family dioxygenase [Rummeliibacillus]|uniref:DODA-type extradiol aromatic ring-opening family dioxygenase n=1 Tax=Rummeliibacillus TaxID=648802 RepID=UPI0011B3E5DA|nr:MULTISPECIES: class III extradiol ring-cleavage dioxygenase [Rummeliibacillus]MBO2535798.1 dioxygenase [Rummeliibacillus suwonensis]